MTYVKAIFLFFHILLTYCFCIHSYNIEQLNFVMRHISSNLIIEDKNMNKYKPGLIKYLLINKFPSNALSVF